MRQNGYMLACVAALAFASTWSATPVGDVWVYPHSATPGGEPFLRVWGDGASAMDTTVPPGDAFSHGYLNFDLKDLPKGELKAAKLVVWNVPNAELTAEVIKAAPLEVFGLKGTFKEDTFSFTDTKCGPVKPSFGKSVGEKLDTGIKLTIDLMDEKGAFKKYVEDARSSGILYLALASVISPEESRSFIYKINSKEAAEKERPVLTLEFAD